MPMIMMETRRELPLLLNQKSVTMKSIFTAANFGFIHFVVYRGTFVLAKQQQGQPSGFHWELVSMGPPLFYPLRKRNANTLHKFEHTWMLCVTKQVTNWRN